MVADLNVRELFSDFGWSDVSIKVRSGLSTPFVTDSGHYLLDCELGEIANPDGLASRLNQIPGVVEHGVYCNCQRGGDWSGGWIG
jgi:ribose 5-phosphate isomerase A